MTIPSPALPQPALTRRDGVIHREVTHRRSWPPTPTETMEMETLPPRPRRAHTVDHFEASASALAEEARESSPTREEPTPRVQAREADEQAAKESGRRRLGLSEMFHGFVDRKKTEKARKQEEQINQKIREAEAKIRQVAYQQGKGQYFKAMRQLRRELFPEQGTPRILPETLKEAHSENCWQQPTLIKEADLEAPNGRHYHLRVEEMGQFRKPASENTLSAHPEGTLLKLDLTSATPQVLHHESWPSPNFEYEKTEYTSPDGFEVRRGFAKMRNSLQRSDKTPQDVMIRRVMLERLHKLLNEGSASE